MTKLCQLDDCALKWQLAYFGPKVGYFGHIFSASGLCSLYARAKVLYRRLVDDVVEIFVFYILILNRFS